MSIASPADAETAEQSFRQLIQQLLGSARNSPDRTKLDYAMRTLEAGAEGMLQLILAIEDLDERVDAFGNAEFLVEAGLRFGLYGGERFVKSLGTEKAREAKAKKASGQISAQQAFLREVLGDRIIDQPYKIAEELFGSAEAAADLNKRAKEAGVEDFKMTTLRRRLIEMKPPTLSE